MTGAVLLGLDVGTTSCKAAVVSEGGEEIAHGRARTPWREVPTGAEIDPEDLLGAALAAAREALGAVEDRGRVAAIGVASLAETGVLLGASGEPVAPSIAWHDSRGEEQAQSLAAALPGFSERTGLSPRPLCGLVKYRWLRDNDAGAGGGVRWLSVAEWVVHRLGGEQRAELSLASRTGWLDIHARGWWDEALEWAGAPPDLLPEPVVAGTPLGTAGDLLGEARGAVLAVGGHDHLSAAVGAGATGEGDVLDSWGTAEAFVRAVAPVPAERVARGGRGRHQRRLARGRGAPVPARRDALRRRDAARARPPRRRPRAPRAARAGGVRRRDRAARAQRGPQRPDRDRRRRDAGMVWRAALESTARAAADILARMDGVAGVPKNRLVMAGGWAEGDAARAVRNAVLGPIERTEAVYMGARGAALTAGRAAGVLA